MVYMRYPIEMGLADKQISNGIIWGAFAGVIALGLLFYALRSIALFTMAKKADVKNAYLAWIPLVWIIIAGKLCGEVNFFGARFKAFVPVLASVFITTSVLSMLHNFFYYFPLVGYFLQGGEIIINNDTAVVVGGYLGNSSILTPNIQFPGMYTQAFATVMNVIYWILNVLELVNTVLLVFMYIGIFKKYFTGYYWIATIFSVIGLFPPFIFAVRKNKPMNYNEYMRTRYAQMYGNSYYGAGQQSPNQSPFEDFNGNDSEPQEPFEEFDENKGNDDPFDEFNGKH